MAPVSSFFLCMLVAINVISQYRVIVEYAVYVRLKRRTSSILMKADDVRELSCNISNMIAFTLCKTISHGYGYSTKGHCTYYDGDDCFHFPKTLIINTQNPVIAMNHITGNKRLSVSIPANMPNAIYAQ